MFGCLGFSVGWFPGHEAAKTRRNGTRLGFQTIRNDHKTIVSKQAGDDGFVGFYLFESRMDGGVFVRGIFELNQHQRNAIDKEQDIGPFVVAIFNDGELVGDDKIVILRVFKIVKVEFKTPIIIKAKLTTIKKK